MIKRWAWVCMEMEGAAKSGCAASSPRGEGVGRQFRLEQVLARRVLLRCDVRRSLTTAAAAHRSSGIVGPYALPWLHIFDLPAGPVPTPPMR